MGSTLPVVKEFAKNEEQRLENIPYTVLLCGPSIKADELIAPAKFRKELHKVLEKNNFTVVLGEDDGLEELRKESCGNAQDNELQFIIQCCDAVVIIASSVGSFCELGLFAWHFAHDGGLISRDKTKTFIVISENEHSPEAIHPKESYFNEGPMLALQGCTINPFYVDFETFKASKILNILKGIRTTRIPPCGPEDKT